MHRGLWNMDHASFFSEATLIDVGVSDLCTSPPKMRVRAYIFSSHYFFCILQGLPKVGSSDFMYYSFWSKLSFYLKFLEDVYFTIENMYSEFQ